MKQERLSPWRWDVSVPADCAKGPQTPCSCCESGVMSRNMSLLHRFLAQILVWALGVALAALVDPCRIVVFLASCCPYDFFYRIRE